MTINMLNKIVVLVFLNCLLVVPTTVEAREYVASLSEVSDCLRKAQPGDRIIVRPGTYSDNTLKWQGAGTEAKPITIEAQQPGTVILSGKTSMQVAGEHLVISGFYFRGVVPTRRGVVDFAIGDRYANHCRLTDCVMDDCNTSRRDVVSSYIVLSGRHNRVDHCSLTGKCTLAVTLLVNLNGEECLENYHQNHAHRNLTAVVSIVAYHRRRQPLRALQR